MASPNILSTYDYDQISCLLTLLQLSRGAGWENAAVREPLNQAIDLLINGRQLSFSEVSLVNRATA